MRYGEMSCGRFLEELSSKQAVPGGGGASALAGALGAALGSMVGNLTLGKKKYADVEVEILTLNERADPLREKLLSLADADAEAFLPLSEVYSMPKETPEEQAARAKAMESALDAACAVPMEIMEASCRVTELLEVYAEKGSTLAVSDAGVGAALCSAAIRGASLNVFINTKYMADREKAAALETKAGAMLAEFVPRAEAVYASVAARLSAKKEG